MENFSPYAENEIANTIINYLEGQVAEMGEEIVLLETKMKARDIIIGRLVRRIAQLEMEMGMDELPPLELRDAFADLG